MIRKIFFVSVSLLIALVLSILIALCIGSVSYSPYELFSILFVGNADAFSFERVVLTDVRLPRICAALLTGGALAAAGVAFQALLRNPLADPYVVGTSAGASLGAAVAVIFNLPAFGVFSSLTPSAFIGAALVMIVVYVAALRFGRLSVERFLLAGVIAGAFCSSLVSFLMTLSGKDIPHIVWWLMGGFSGREDWSYPFAMLPYFIVGVLILIIFSPTLNLFSMGEDIASSRGVNTELSKFMIIFSASLLTAASVSIAGTIGFIGFMIPHVMRRIFGAEHRVLMISSVLGGAVFLILADTLARSILTSGAEIPVGIITSLLGAPFFFLVLKKGL